MASNKKKAKMANRAKSAGGVVDLNWGRRYHIKGNLIRGYVVLDSENDNEEVFRSEYADDVYKWRDKVERDPLL